MTLRGNTHPLARAKYDQGAAPDALPTRRMLLLLSRTPEQQASLDQLLQDQQNPNSPQYRHWLTPEDFSKNYGPAPSDIQQISSWLQTKGFTVDRVRAGNTVVEFSGTAGQVRDAFRTSIHKYRVNGRESWANSSDPQIPTALAPVVTGVVSLNNFPRKPLARKFGAFKSDTDGKITPQFTLTGNTATYYALAPSDFATIYNTKPLLQAGIDGTGQTIAILGESNVNLQDVSDFRRMFGLGTGNTTVIVDGPNPGLVDGDETESLLDLEWSNAVAPGASVVLVTAQSTETTAGTDLAAIHVIDNNLASVVNLSYGVCEAHLGNAGNQFVTSLWQQAAAEGITVVVSSGDDGSAGCDSQNGEYIATAGFGVNGLASTAYNVAVGGTDFDDANRQSLYWNSTNDPVTYASAKTYIPESTWNETCAALATSSNLNVCPTLDLTSPADSLSLWSGSGGPSSCSLSTTSGGTTTCQSGTAKPAWQSGTGVPADGVRDIPDVSLFAAAESSSNSFYVVGEADALSSPYLSCNPAYGYYFLGVGGTSGSAPSFAGIVALANQKAGVRLGNLNYLLYSIAAGSGASCASGPTPAASCIFNDVVKGNNSVPCKAGSPNCSATSGTSTGVLVKGSTPAYTATAGYDLATGLGSVNAANLVNAIAAKVGTFTPTATSLTLNGGTGAVTASHGSSIDVGVSVTPTASVGNVSVMGSKGSIDSRSLNSGAASWSSPLFPGGTYTVKAHYPGDGSHGASDSNGISVTISPESSKTFSNIVSYDKSTGLNFTSSSVVYGSSYWLRLDVADTAGTLSPSTGINSKCSNNTASCPTGTLNLTVNGLLQYPPYQLNSSGFAEDQLVQYPAGSYSLSASYSGDASYTASTGSSSLTVTKASTTTTANLGAQTSYTYGNAAYFGATVNTTSSGLPPSGSATIIDNGVGQTPQSGAFIDSRGTGSYAQSRAIVTYAPTSVGTHSLAVGYSGDGNYLSSTSNTLSITVSPGDTFSNCTASLSAATPTLPVTITCTVSGGLYGGKPTGNLTLYDNGVPLSGTVTYTNAAGSGYQQANLTGTATMNLPVGTHVFTSTYTGDANYNGSNSNSGQTVKVADKIPVSLSSLQAIPNPVLPNYSDHLQVSFGRPDPRLPAATGTFTFYDNGVPMSVTPAYSTQYVNYYADIQYSWPTSGSHQITATYSGDSLYASSTSPALTLQVVDKLPTISSGYAQNVAVGEITHLTADVRESNFQFGPTMSGTVTFMEGQTVLPGTVTYTPGNGSLSAVLPYAFSTIGTHDITFQYSGDANYAPSSSSPLHITTTGPISIALFQKNLVSPGGSTFHDSFSLYNYTSSPTPVTLSCKSDSTAATCSVDTTTVTLNPYGVINVNVTYTWPGLTGEIHHPRHPFSTMPFVFAGLLAGLVCTRRRKRMLTLALLVGAVVLSMASCGGGGGGSSLGGGGSIAPVPKAYIFTITATSGSYSDSQTLSVLVTK